MREDVCDVALGICEDGIGKRTVQMLSHTKTTGSIQVGACKGFIERDCFEGGVPAKASMWEKQRAD